MLRPNRRAEPVVFLLELRSGGFAETRLRTCRQVIAIFTKVSG